MKKCIVWFFLAAILLGLSGCQSKQVYTGENTGTSCGNITMGSGTFAINNGFIYFYTHSSIHEYDMESGKTVTLELKNNTWPWGIFASEDYIFYLSGGLRYISKDGKKDKLLFDREGGCRKFFADGIDGFYIGYEEESLFHRDMNTGAETELLSDVNSYCVDDSYIYAIAKQGEERKLFLSTRADMQFEAVELSFHPVAVNTGSNGIFLAKQGNFQIIQYAGNEETALPIESYYYQAIGDSIIYSDEREYRNSCFPVKKYDLNTGEITLLCENVYNFCVLEDRYVCCHCLTAGVSSYILVDLQTGTSTQMYPKVDDQ